MISSWYWYSENVPKWHLIAICIVGYILYYLVEVVKRPKLAVSHGAFKEFLLNNISTIESKFWPTIWCIESRAQTLVASVLRQTIFPTIHYRREILTLKDGGVVALDWMEDGCEKSSPLILIFPGLTGESRHDYIRCLVMAAQSIGVRTVVFNNRGLGGVELKTPRLYCAANIEDISEVVSHIKKQNPNVRLGATGVSMGGLILGNYMAENGLAASKIFTACQLISVPWNVHKSIPIGAALNSSHVAIVITARGGHIGFLEGIWPILKDQYISRVFGQYFAATLFDNANFSETAEQMMHEFDLRNSGTKSEEMTKEM